MIEFKDFKKGFGGELLFDIEHLVLRERLYWLVGANGVGKTTLLKSIAGLIPFAGDILVDEINIRKEKMKFRLVVNYAEAEPVYPEFLSGQDLLNLYSYSKKASSGQVTYLLNKFQIDGFLKKMAGTFSSGMAKKLSLVLAFIGNPKLILLDEPFISLDQQAIEHLQQLISEYFDMGTSFLISSHQDLKINANLMATSLEVKNSEIIARTYAKDIQHGI